MGLFLSLTMFLLSFMALAGGFYYFYQLEQEKKKNFVEIPTKPQPMNPTKETNTITNFNENRINFTDCLTYQQLANYNGIINDQIFLVEQLKRHTHFDPLKIFLKLDTMNKEYLDEQT